MFGNDPQCRAPNSWRRKVWSIEVIKQPLHFGQPTRTPSIGWTSSVLGRTYHQLGEQLDDHLLAAKKSGMRILVEELEIAKLEEEKERAKRISEKEMEIARAGSIRASTRLRSVSPVTIQSDPFKKVPSWLDQIEVDDKLTTNGKEVSRIALASEPIQRQSGASPHTTKRFQPAAKMPQPTVSNEGNSGNLFVPNVAPVTLKRPHHIMFSLETVYLQVNQQRTTI